MNKVAEFLIESKKLIEDPTHWTTGWFAKTNTGASCSSLDDRAVCFCSLGALERHDKRELPYAVYVGGVPSLSKLAQQALETVMGCSVEDFNDDYSHAMVMEKWDEAINFAKTKGGAYENI